MIYLEDFKPGDVWEFGRYTMTEEEMVAFARQYDPQSFHVDPEAAKDGPFGGLIASGWHTAGAFMRMIVEGYLHESASLGSPGVDEVRWVRPVRPGDVLSVRLHVLESKPSRSKPDRGVMRAYSEVINQNEEVVMTMQNMGMFLRRPAG